MLYFVRCVTYISNLRKIGQKLRSPSTAIGTSSDRVTLQVIVYSVQCHELHWADNNIKTKIIRQKLHKNKNKYTSYPDWHISPHADRRHRKQFTTLAVTVHSSPVSLSHRANDRRTGCRFVLPKFFHFLAWGANPWAKVHQKGRWPGGLRDLPSCKISSLYANPRRRYPLPKSCGQNDKTNKQTVNDISPTCLSACGDNYHWTKKLKLNKIKILIRE